ncbi:MAG: RluA family pseudouridine synthase [Rhodobacterales bacterium]|nr:RluA family pseudouridine synthase [Rhodobacterales bacterium]
MTETEVPRIVLERVRVPAHEGRIRLEQWSTDLFQGLASRAAARKACKRGDILLNGETASGSVFVEAGADLTRLEPTGKLPKVFPMALEVVFEDAHMAVVNKPPGYRVNGNLHRTLEHALPHNLAPSDQPDALRQFRPVHRLDRPTGGMVICAKTGRALMALGQQFENRQIQKKYRAICVGKLDGSGEVHEPIEERLAHSSYAVVCSTRSLRTKWVTTIDLWPRTGRTHQLRLHMAHLGYPILGDTLYGTPGEILVGKGLFLWATTLMFTHPISGEALSLEVPEPGKFESFRKREIRRWNKYNEPVKPV